jgi:hypothetical protein
MVLLLQKFTNFAIANKAFKDSRKMDLGALAWIERSNMIENENDIPAFTGGVFDGLEYKLGLIFCLKMHDIY